MTELTRAHTYILHISMHSNPWVVSKIQHFFLLNFERKKKSKQRRHPHDPTLFHSLCILSVANWIWFTNKNWNKDREKRAFEKKWCPVHVSMQSFYFTRYSFYEMDDIFTWLRSFATAIFGVFFIFQYEFMEFAIHMSKEIVSAI